MRQPASRRTHTTSHFTEILCMSKFLEYPPFVNVVSVLEECPYSISIYIRLWKEKNIFQNVVHKRDIQEKYHISEQDFLKHLSSLQSAKVLFFEEYEFHFLVNHVMPEISVERKMLC